MHQIREVLTLPSVGGISVHQFHRRSFSTLPTLRKTGRRPPGEHFGLDGRKCSAGGFNSAGRSLPGFYIPAIASSGARPRLAAILLSAAT
jgi:hypothetical protein